MKGNFQHIGFELVQVPTFGPLRVSSIVGRSNILVVALSGIGTDPSVAPPFEFIATASAYGERHVLLISDVSRSWMNAEGLAEEIVSIIEVYTREHSIEKVVTLGNSMGGFAALILADLTKIDVVISFSSQFSACLTLVPEETRWTRWQKAIEDWRFLDVGTMAAPGTIYYVFHGDKSEELHHWIRFPWRGAFNHFIFSKTGHRLAPRLQKRGILQPVVAAAIKNEPRRVRKQLERQVLDRAFKVERREIYQTNNPDLTVTPDGAPAVYPTKVEESA